MNERSSRSASARASFGTTSTMASFCPLSRPSRSLRRRLRRRRDADRDAVRVVRNLAQRQIAKQRAIAGGGRLVLERAFDLHPAKGDARLAILLGQRVLPVHGAAGPGAEEPAGVGHQILAGQQATLRRGLPPWGRAARRSRRDAG